MGTSASANGSRVRRAALFVTAVSSIAALTIELTLLPFEDPGTLIRGGVYLIAAAISLVQLRRDAETGMVLLFIGASFVVMSIVDLLFGTQISLIDPLTTLTLLVLLAVLAIGTTAHHTKWFVATLSASIYAYAVVVAVLGDLTTVNAVGLMLVGGVGQALVLWTSEKLIETLGAASRRAQRHARVEAALASCSEALLRSGATNPLQAAIEALLDATEADYAYVDVNRTDETGSRQWEIIADAFTDDYPGGESQYMSGDYYQMEFVEEALRRGDSCTVITEDLPMPIRAEYEEEEIKAELIAPVMIGDRWMGSLGYIDHVRPGTWTDIEVDGLKRAADMISAYWQREAAREGLMELAKAKDRFIASVSHELRTPLSAVVGFASELVESISSLDEHDVDEMATLIYEQSLEVSHLVDDLLTAERAASGNLTVRPTEIQLLDECYEIVKSLPSVKQVDIVGEPVVARADGLRTRQIVRNLVTNADRYGGDRIEIAISAEPDVAHITVRDNGPGATEPDPERIFDPYYRSQNGNTTPDSVGLGLAVARQLARLMGGDLVYMRAGRWTMFELTLPLANNVAEPEEDAADVHVPARLSANDDSLG